MPNVLVAIPSHSGTITVPTLNSLVNAIAESYAQGWQLNIKCTSGDADIARARNAFIGDFRADLSYTHLFYVDADVSWNDGGMSRILSHEVDFVAGVYRKKQDEVGYPVHWPPQRAMNQSRPGYPLFKADFVPAGFLCLSRRCIDMMSAAPDIQWANDEGHSEKFPFLFDWIWDQGKRRSEDYAFCKRWRDLGGTVWVDPAITFGHTGIKTYEGALVEHMTREYYDHLAQCSPAERARLVLETGT